MLFSSMYAKVKTVHFKMGLEYYGKSNYIVNYYYT